jgi:hypothetical protein
MTTTTKTERSKIWHNLLNISHTHFFAFAMACGLLLAVFPQITPVVIDPTVHEFYNYIEGLEDGDVWLLTESGNVMDPFSIQANRLVFWTHAFAKPGIKILCFSLVGDANINVENILRYMPQWAKDSKTYGVDWVYLGFVPGEESAVAALFSDIRSVVTVDYYGNPIDSLPMMTTGHPDTGGPINDYTAYTTYTPMHWAANFIEAEARVAGETYGVPIIKPNLGPMNWAYYAPFYPHYITHYYLMQHQVAYEYLLGLQYGFAGPNMQIYSTRYIFTAVLLGLFAVVNIRLIYERFLRKDEEVTVA